MQGKKKYTPKIFYHLSLDALVPGDNFYRKVQAELALDLLYKATRNYYGKEGQQSIEPLVFFKILLVGYLNNINSDRALLRFCSNKVTKFKKLDDSIHKPLYDAMHEKLNRDRNYTRMLTKRRSSTVEPVLGTLINHHNMKKVNARGIKNANKHVLMAALTYNLKKYLKFITRKVHRNAQIMNLPQGKFSFWQNLFPTASIASI